MKRLGKNWKRLHKLIYVIAPLVIFHFLLVVKGDITRLAGDISQPILYGAITAVLLIVRIPPVKAALLGLRYQIEAAARGKGHVVLRPATPDETPKS
jgi:sulfoxide reductase heme-binding subunit YedZ